MKLIIVESPNKRATIKSFLDSSYDVEASVGHIRRIADTGWWQSGIDPNRGFAIDFEVDPAKRKVVANLRRLAEKAEVVYLASDGDREGEAIAWHLRDVLRLKKDKYRRVVFNEITKKEVLKGLANPRDIDGNLVEAALARSSIDKLLGYRVSPVVMRLAGGRSAGRVQSAALKIVCDRERQIKAFASRKFQALSLRFRANGKEWTAKLKRVGGKPAPEIPSKEAAKALIDSFKADKATVASIAKAVRAIGAPAPFDTSAYQQAASARLGLPPKEAMRCAQRLFEGLQLGGKHMGLITYIRTDSTRMDGDFKKGLMDLVGNLFGEAAKGEVRETKSKSKEQGAHECIRPTDLSNSPRKIAPYLPDDSCRKAYALIYCHTVACAMAPCRIEDETIAVGDGNLEFELVGHRVLDPGWRAAYGPKAVEKAEAEVPALNEGDKVEVLGIDMAEKATQPPKRYTEAKLIDAMESDGIGRPSTYASTMTILTDPKRDYAREQKRAVIPTDKGMAVSKFLDEHFGDVINLKYTSDMESRLDNVAQGKETRIQVVGDFFEAMMAEIAKLPDEAQAGAGKANGRVPPEPAGKKCPACGSPIVKRRAKDGREFYGCSGFPKCRKTWSPEAFENLG